MSWVVDSSAWLEYFMKGRLSERFAVFLDKANPENYFTPATVLFEVFKKIKKEHGEQTAARYIAHIKGHTAIVAVTECIALLAADASLNYKLAFADALVKATADSLKAKLLTGDHHFKGLSNVELIE